MKHTNPTWKYFAPVIILILLASVSTGWILSTAGSQTQSRTVSNRNVAVRSATENSPNEVVKVDVDLITVDALVLQKKTARIVGGLKKDDFTLFEDGVKQDITHFGQDSLPLSVLLLNLRSTFNTLIEHLRTRYNLAFVSSNKKRDGTMRKLKINVAEVTQKSQSSKLVVRARRSYVAPRS
jgi:hypothetical protein